MSMNKTYITSYCNSPHRMVDGKPVNHECYVLPTAALVAEQRGNVAQAHEILQSWKNRRRHNGVKSRPTG